MFNLGIITEYILAYSSDRAKSPPFIGGVTTAGKKYPINNAGNGIQTLCFPRRSVRFKCSDGEYELQSMSDGAIITRLLDNLIVKKGFNENKFRLEG